VAILSIFFLGWYLGHKKAVNASNTSLSALKQEIQRYTVELDKKTVYVAEINQELKTLREAKTAGDIENKELKALHLKTVEEVTFLKAQLVIFQDSVFNTGEIIIVNPCDSIKKPAIVLPFTFKDKTEYYDIFGGFDLKGKMNISLNVPISLDVWAGLDKQTKQYKAVVTSTNPHVHINEIKSLKLDVPKVRRFGIGIQIGYGFEVSETPRFAPVISLGLNYNVIRF
jgi:hypothetical protein